MKKVFLLLFSLVLMAPLAFGENETSKFSHTDYGVVLERFVSKNGLVDYRRLKSDDALLNRYLQSLAHLGEEELQTFSEKEKIAFWINAYNALTLKAIIDNYPIKASSFRSFIFPKNSIRQIPGVWDGLKFRVKGEEITLEHIEHKILRKKFNEPRIHMALVCAALGCPLLRYEPYVASRLEEQLEDQGRTFHADSNKFRIDRKRGEVHLSRIYELFGKDFIKTYGRPKIFRGHSEEEESVLSFVSRYVSEEDKNYILNAEFDIEILKYDWSLNELR